MARVIIEAAPATLETVASILRTFADRGPSGERLAVKLIADRFDESATSARTLDVNWRPEDYVAG